LALRNVDDTVSQIAFPAVIGYLAAQAKTVIGVALGAVQIEPQGMGRAVKHMAGKAVLICPCCLDAFPLRVGRTGTEQEQCAQTRILGMLRLLEDAESVDYTTLAITTLFLGGALSVSSNPARGEGFWAACKNHTHSA